MKTLEDLCEELVSWRHCMSYNDSYFGEPRGLLKGLANEMKHKLPVKKVLAQEKTTEDLIIELGASLFRMNSARAILMGRSIATVRAAPWYVNAGVKKNIKDLAKESVWNVSPEEVNRAFKSDSLECDTLQSTGTLGDIVVGDIPEYATGGYISYKNAEETPWMGDLEEIVPKDVFIEMGKAKPLGKEFGKSLHIDLR